MSNRFSSVFGKRFQTLARFSHKITALEAELLSSRASEDITAVDLTELPFQVAAGKLNGLQVSMAQLATELAEDLLRNPGDASKQQAYFFLQMAADSTKQDDKLKCQFGSTLNGDYFYVDSDSQGRYFIADREGFEVIAVMQSRMGDYEH